MTQTTVGAEKSTVGFPFEFPFSTLISKTVSLVYMPHIFGALWLSTELCSYLNKLQKQTSKDVVAGGGVIGHSVCSFHCISCIFQNQCW